MHPIQLGISMLRPNFHALSRNDIRVAQFAQKWDQKFEQPKNQRSICSPLQKCAPAALHLGPTENYESQFTTLRTNR